MNWLEFLKLFFKGAVLDSSTDKLRARANVLDDALMTVIFSEAIGVPNPLFYYLIELLPYIYQDLEGWNRRLEDRSSIISRVLGEFGEP